jgi:hypothetical protein
MAGRFDAARCSRLVLAFCMLTTAAVRSEELEAPKEQRRTADRPSSSQKPPSTLRPQETDETGSAPGRLFRWERLRNAVGSFRARRHDTAEEPARRRRWIVGRDVKYVPGEETDSPEPARAKADPAVALAAYEPVAEPRQATAPAPLGRGVADAGAGALRQIAEEDPRGSSPPLLPLPTPSPGLPANGTGGIRDAAVLRPAGDLRDEWGGG